MSFLYPVKDHAFGRRGGFAVLSGGGTLLVCVCRMRLPLRRLLIGTSILVSMAFAPSHFTLSSLWPRVKSWPAERRRCLDAFAVVLTQASEHGAGGEG